MTKLLLLRVVVAVLFVFCALTASWSIGGYVRTKTTPLLLAAIGFTVLTLALARALKALARRR